MIIKIIYGLLITFSIIVSHGSFANTKPLDANKAFIFKLEKKSSQELTAIWEIAPDYYLYRNRIHIRTNPSDLIANMQFPRVQWKQDIDQNLQAVYAGLLKIPLNLKQGAKNFQLIIDYQGCSKKGFCYPPMQKVLSVNANNLGISNVPANKATLSELLTSQRDINSLLFNNHIAITLLMFIGLGLLLSFTPCVLPMVPILTAIIVGQKQVSLPRAFALSLTYVLGMALTYAAAGILAAWMGSSLQVLLQKPMIIGAVSALFILLALSLLGVYELQMPASWRNRLTHLSNQQPSGRYVGVFAMGVISTLVVSPCVTAPLVGVLIFISQTGNLMVGGSALFALGIGMGIPLLLIGMSAGRFLPKSGPWMELVKKSFGFMMLATAIWLTARIINAPTVNILWGIWFLLLASYIGFHLIQITQTRLLTGALSLSLAFVGTLFILGGAGFSIPLVTTKGTSIAQKQFVVVKNINDFNHQLIVATASDKPILLDFYASWCDSCVVMDKKVFSLPDVQRQLTKYVLLRADLSDNTGADEALLKYFNVVAPPTILFFDSHGKEIDANRIVGEVNATEFLTRLNKIS